MAVRELPLFPLPDVVLVPQDVLLMANVENRGGISVTTFTAISTISDGSTLTVATNGLMTITP